MIIQYRKLRGCKALLLVGSSAKLASTKYDDVGFCLVDYAQSVGRNDQKTAIEHYEKLFRVASLHSSAYVLVYNGSNSDQLCFSFVIDFNQ